MEEKEENQNKKKVKHKKIIGKYRNRQISSTQKNLENV